MINSSSQGSQQVKDVGIVVPRIPKGKSRRGSPKKHFLKRSIPRSIAVLVFASFCSQIPQDCSCQHEVCACLSPISTDQPHLGDTKALAAKRYAKAFLLGAG